MHVSVNTGTYCRYAARGSSRGAALLGCALRGSGGRADDEAPARASALRPAITEGVALSTLLSARQLGNRALEVSTLLRAGDVTAARRHVGTHLVSRETAGLSAPLVASAAIESVAENLTDSVVVPLFFYAIGGLPGAAAYRVVNTADAMYGYRDVARAALHKAAARLDEALNYLPGRLAVLLLAAAGGRPS